MVKLILVAILLALSVGAYVRFAPSDPNRFDSIPGDFTGQAGFITLRGGAIYESQRLLATSAEVLDALQKRALATPRTRLLSGSVGSGKLTFITRSAVFGLPDYATMVTRSDGEFTSVRIYSRLRFGVSDIGVNRARLSTWVQALERFAK